MLEVLRSPTKIKMSLKILVSTALPKHTVLLDHVLTSSQPSYRSVELLIPIWGNSSSLIFLTDEKTES